jgi:hypothetical protein
VDVNPVIRRALGELSTLLEDYHYSQHARERIVAYTAREGTPTGCPELDPEDDHDAEMVFVAELPEIPFDSPAWDREDVFLDVRMLAAGVHPLPFGDGPDAPDADPQFAFPGIAPLAERLALPSISGGAPGHVYTDQDHADHMAWLDSLDAGHPPQDQPETPRGDGYTAEDLGRIHLALYGQARPFHA